MLHHLVSGLLLVCALHFIFGVLLDYILYYLFKNYFLKKIKVYMATVGIMLAIFYGKPPAPRFIHLDETGNPICISSCSHSFPACLNAQFKP